MANDRTRERKTYPFFRQRPIFEAACDALGGPVPTGTGFRHVTAGVEDAAAKLVENADVAVAAAIAVSKISFSASPVVASGGLSGSLMNLSNGTSYIVAGPGLSIVSQSNGQILISAPAAEGVRPTEFSFLSGLASTTLSTFQRIGARKIDISSYPASIGSSSRNVYFFADIDMTSGATTTQVQLYDTTHLVAVTGTSLTSASTASFEVTSSALTVGSSAGNVRSDVASQYELQLKMNGGGVNDAVFCTNARLVITYT